MRIKNICPKCSSSDVIRIPGRKDSHGNNILIGMTIRSSIKVTRYLCGGCGFSEEWIDDAKDIEIIKAKYKNS
ncbi:hypothetical protein P4C99_20925 [Pontiellaceae bacterium B1224]|nr:hypothetical protein [Pontiellaceae bacterium B1224]